MAFDAEEFKGPGGVNVAQLLALAEQVERSSTFDMSRAEVIRQADTYEQAVEGL